MKRALNAFTNWMERGPSWQTLWFLPLLILLGLIAWGINQTKRKDIRTQ